MAKTFKTILIRDLPEVTNNILNEVGEKEKLKTGTDIILFIIHDYQRKRDNFKRLEELYHEQRGKVVLEQDKVYNLKGKLNEIQRIIDK